MSRTQHSAPLLPRHIPGPLLVAIVVMLELGPPIAFAVLLHLLGQSAP